MMFYTLPLLLLHGEAWATMLREALDACEAVGMKVLMDIEQITPPNVANSTADWSSVIRVVENVKAHPATLGYYICGACATSKSLPLSLVARSS